MVDLCSIATRISMFATRTIVARKTLKDHTKLMLIRMHSYSIYTPSPATFLLLLPHYDVLLHHLILSATSVLIKFTVTCMYYYKNCPLTLALSLSNANFTKLLNLDLSNEYFLMVVFTLLPNMFLRILCII